MDQEGEGSRTGGGRYDRCQRGEAYCEARSAGWVSVKFREVDFINRETLLQGRGKYKDWTGQSSPVPEPYPVFEEEGEKETPWDYKKCEKWIYVFRNTEKGKIKLYREIKVNESGKYQRVDLETKKLKKKQEEVWLKYEEKRKDKATQVDNFFCLSRIRLPSTRVDELQKDLEKKYTDWLKGGKKSSPTDRLVFQKVGKSTTDIFLTDHFSDAARYQRSFVVGREKYLKWEGGYCDPNPKNCEKNLKKLFGKTDLSNLCDPRTCPLKKKSRTCHLHCPPPHKVRCPAKKKKEEPCPLMKKIPRARMKILSEIVCDVCGLKPRKREDAMRARKHEKKSGEASQKELTNEQKEELRKLQEELKGYLGRRDPSRLIGGGPTADLGGLVKKWINGYYKMKKELLGHIDYAKKLRVLLDSEEFKEVLHDYESGGPKTRAEGEEHLSRVIEFFGESDIGRQYFRKLYEKRAEGKKNWVNWLFSPARKGSEASFRLLQAMAPTIIEVEGKNGPKELADLVNTYLDNRPLEPGERRFRVEPREEPVTTRAVEELVKRHAKLHALSQDKPSARIELQELVKSPKKAEKAFSIDRAKVAVDISKTAYDVTVEVLDVVARARFGEVEEASHWLENILKIPDKIARLLTIINLGFTVKKLEESKTTSEKIENAIALAKGVTNTLIVSTILHKLWEKKFGKQVAAKLVKRWTGIISGVVDAFLGGWDAIKAYGLDDLDAAHAAAMSAIGGVITIIGAISGAFIWTFAGLLIGLFAALLFTACQDTAVKSWVKHCYWGMYYGPESGGPQHWAKGNKDDNGYFYEWVGDLDQQIQAFQNMWYDFEIEMRYVPTFIPNIGNPHLLWRHSNLEIKIKPTRIRKDSEIHLSVWIRNDEDRFDITPRNKGLVISKRLFRSKNFGPETKHIFVDFVDEIYFPTWYKERARIRGRETRIGIRIPPFKNAKGTKERTMRDLVMDSSLEKVEIHCQARLDVSGSKNIVVPSYGWKSFRPKEISRVQRQTGTMYQTIVDPPYIDKSKPRPK